MPRMQAATFFLPQIDATKCTGCGLCIRICPNQVLAMRREWAIVAKPGACNYSGACQEACPTQAITLPFEIVF